VTVACLSSKILSVVWYSSHNYDKLSLGLVIRSNLTMSSLNARMANSAIIPIKNITLRVNWIMLKFCFCYDSEMIR